MTKIDNFKSFVRKNPSLAAKVKNHNTTWQELYELYDMYGEDSNIWNDYTKKEETRAFINPKTSSGNTLNNIIEMTKNIDTNKLQDGITSMQKAISLFTDMIVKDKTNTNSYTPRPIYRKFDD